MLLLFLLALLLSSCSYNEVVFKGVQGVSVGRFDQKGLALTAQVALDNPNNYRIQVKDPDVDVYVNEIYLGKAHLDQKVILLKRSSAVYSVPLYASFDGNSSNVLSVLLSTALSGQGVLRVKGTVTGGLGPLLSRKFPFEETETLDLRQIR